jgi:SAM-dependent methyltransferase
MASVEQNRTMWDRTYDWSEGGDEWSSGWGGPRPQWCHWIEPRLLAALGPAHPAVSTVVEIGCGHGRWTGFLADRYEHVTAFDLAPGCVEVCRVRFSERPGVRVSVCDGASLPGVEDRSVDLVFSFDSLVHADRVAIDGYLAECARVLTTDGLAFLHHSNLASCGIDRWRLLDHRWARRPLAAVGLAEPTVHWRDPSVDADLVVGSAAAHGLRCVHQELVRWGTQRRFTDCISVLERGPASGGPVRTECTTFLEDMERTARRSSEGGGARG